MLGFIWWRLLAVRVDFFIFAFFLLLYFFIFIFLPFTWFLYFSPFHLVPDLKKPKVLLKYWPKLCPKKELSESQKSVTVLRTVRSDHGSHGSLFFFPKERFLKLKKPQNWEVHGFPDRTGWSGTGFKTLPETWLKIATWLALDCIWNLKLYLDKILMYFHDKAYYKMIIRIFKVIFMNIII